MDTEYVVAVAAIIFREGKVLAMRRGAHKDAGAGWWETLSGRVQLGEQPLDAAYREIAEEAGITVRLDPRPLEAVETVRGDRPMIVLYYTGDWVAGEVVRSDEHDDHAWLTPVEFDARSVIRPLAAAVYRAASGTG